MWSVVSEVHREVESFRTGPARRRGARDPRAPIAAALCSYRTANAELRRNEKRVKGFVRRRCENARFSISKAFAHGRRPSRVCDEILGSASKERRIGVAARSAPVAHATTRMRRKS
jgi:hypothetical protein